MPKISACIIALNEEAKIGDCIRSLLPVVDEVVVVDSGSTDRTVEIAREHGCRVTTHAFDGYGKQKNHAVEQAEHDWILSLDCDERLSPELQASIQGAKDGLSEDTAYGMARKTFYVYRWLNRCWYPNRQVRLFHRRRTRWHEKEVHESVQTGGLAVEILDGDIQHYSFDSFSDHLRTIDKFTEIGARDLLAKGRRVHWFSPLTHGSWTFFRLYVLRLGFLDGFAGLAVSVLSYVHAFVKYSRAYVAQRRGAGG